MTKQWDEVPFGELAEFRNGLNFSSSAYGPGTKFIGVADFKDYFVPKYETLSEVISDGLVKQDSLLKNGDILFVRSNGNKDLVGRSLFIRNLAEDVAYSGFCIRARPTSQRVDSLFLAYFCKSEAFRKRVANAAGGANIQSLSQPVLARCPIPLPPISVQKTIVRVLSAYDDLIENNQMRIKLLEEMARITYEEWFIRLRFPGNKTTMINSDTGLPIGWKTLKCIDAMDVLSGGTPKTAVGEYWDGEIPFYTPKDAADCPYVFRTEKTVSKLGVSKCNSKLYPKDTVFITARGTVGKVNLAAVPMIMNQSCYALRARAGISQYFLFFSIKSAIEAFKGASNGGVFNTIVVDTFKFLPFILPEKTLVDKFSEMVAPLLGEMFALTKQNQYLREAREILLPRLMAGVINVEQYDHATLFKEVA